MSFGVAAATCPCGSGAAASACCGPLLAGAAAPTAERLMRSRYTAFVRGDSDHLRRTWHPRTRPEHVGTDGELTWGGLEILDAREHGDEAVVEFRARWSTPVERGVLHERSRFARRGGRWLYVDGEVTTE